MSERTVRSFFLNVIQKKNPIRTNCSVELTETSTKFLVIRPSRTSDSYKFYILAIKRVIILKLKPKYAHFSKLRVVKSSKQLMSIKYIQTGNISRNFSIN